MNTSELKKFAQGARRQLIEQVGARLDLVLQTDSAQLREQEKTVGQLREEIAKSSKTAVIERVLCPALYGCQSLYPHRHGEPG